MKENARTRNWATIVYQESAPSDWISKLEDTHIPAFISPLHNNDLDKDGKIKNKAHYHILLMFDGVKTREQVIGIVEQFGGVGTEYVNSVHSMARYLCHLDNKDKAKYSIEDVISLSGADYKSMISFASDKYTAISEMIDYCMDNAITSYAALLIYAKEHRSDWFRVLCDNGTVTIVQFLKSKTWERKQFQQQSTYK